MQNKKEEPTKVKFVVFKGEVVALFPEITEGTNGEGYILSYQHMGQHSTASRDLLKCRNAKEEEYQELKTELEGIGYELAIL